MQRKHRVEVQPGRHRRRFDERISRMRRPVDHREVQSGRHDSNEAGVPEYADAVLCERRVRRVRAGRAMHATRWRAR